MEYTEENNEDVSTGRGLRAQLEAALAKLDAAESRLAEKEKAEKDLAFKSFVEAKGLNPRILELIPASVDSTEAAEEWFNSYADVFGLAVSNTGEQSKPFNLAEAASATRMQNLSNTGQRPSSVEDLQSRILDAGKNGQDPLQVLRDSKDLML